MARVWIALAVLAGVFMDVGGARACSCGGDVLVWPPNGAWDIHTNTVVRFIAYGQAQGVDPAAVLFRLAGHASDGGPWEDRTLVTGSLRATAFGTTNRLATFTPTEDLEPFTEYVVVANGTSVGRFRTGDGPLVDGSPSVRVDFQHAVHVVLPGPHTPSSCHEGNSFLRVIVEGFPLRREEAMYFLKVWREDESPPDTFSTAVPVFSRWQWFADVGTCTALRPHTCAQFQAALPDQTARYCVELTVEEADGTTTTLPEIRCTQGPADCHGNVDAGAADPSTDASVSEPRDEAGQDSGCSSASAVEAAPLAVMAWLAGIARRNRRWRTS